jgi:magnesium-transporting ATPase (P-type)
MELANPRTDRFPSANRIMHQTNLRTVFKQLDASEEGLTRDEAERRLDRYGFNEPTPTRRAGAAVQLALLLANPLCLILLMARLVSALLGEGFSAVIIVTMVLLNVVLSWLYDFLTFFILLKLFHASETLFHTGWFVESLVTHTLVLFIIRTAGNPFRSRPSRPLLGSVLLVVLAGILLPYSPLAGILGFTPLPAFYLLFLAVATGSYLLLVELAKRHLLRRFLN